MIYNIIDSATGETLGTGIIFGMDDEIILEWLCSHGYLTGGADNYEISRTYPFAEGKIVVLDFESQQPVLALEEPPEHEDKAA